MGSTGTVSAAGRWWWAVPAIALASCAGPTTPEPAGSEGVDHGSPEGGPASAVEASVAPGINESYLLADLNPDDWVRRFEVESREVYAARLDIVRAVGVRPGQAVADIGAGTGLFVEPLARLVGSAGRVYAIDIAPVFVKHVARRAEEKGLAQVEARLGQERSIDLPAGSIDVAFTVDTYHHFEYPSATLASIRAALRPGGTFIIVDFERIPGVSSEWILGHVRAGKEEVIGEVEAAGFELVEEVDLGSLEENYFLRFRRP